MWYCSVIELHAYDFVIKGFVIKRDAIWARSCILNYVVGNYLYMFVTVQNEGNLSVICFLSEDCIGEG